MFQPVFHALHPGVRSGIIGMVQAVADVADKCFWNGQLHVRHITAARPYPLSPTPIFNDPSVSNNSLRSEASANQSGWRTSRKNCKPVGRV